VCPLHATDKTSNPTDTCGGRYRSYFGLCVERNSDEKYLASSLPDGKVVKSTHVCNFELPGLPTILEGHIVPDLAVALLVGIRILCKAG
jgi:hypothetical protein